MISWRGVPDFGQSMEIQGQRLFRAADEANLFVYLPARLEMARRSPPLSGLDFSIEVVRGVNPFKPPQPYGVLDFRLHPLRPDVTVMNAVQQEYPQAVLASPLFAGGWLRLHHLVDPSTSASSTAADACDFGLPTPLAANGLEAVRCIRRLTQDQVSLLKQVLQDHSLTFSALAEMELWGLATRLPVHFDFVPADLLAELRTLADAQGTLSIQTLINFWMQDPSVLPIMQPEGFDAVESIHLWQTLVAWTISEFGEYVAAPTLPVQPTCRLKELQDPPALARWNLRQERLVPTLVLLEFDPFRSARQIVETQGLASFLTETIVPALETGVVSLTLGANLPANLKGLLRLGVDLFAPPHPPERIQPLTASVLFDDPQALHTVNWRFSMAEDAAYQFTTFVLLRTATGIQRLEGIPTLHTGAYLLLSVADFPLGFIPVQASDLLLSEAVLKGVCVYVDPATSTNVEIPFTLDTAHPLLTLTLPLVHVEQAHLRLQACSIKTGKVLLIGEFPARSLCVDLFNLREYGVHTIAVEVEFDTPAEMVAVDLLSEAKLAQPEQTTVLSFTPVQPAKSWSYMAISPFSAGYVYRNHLSAGQPNIEWSEVQSPFSRLKLKVSELNRLGTAVLPETVGVERGEP